MRLANFNRQTLEQTNSSGRGTSTCFFLFYLLCMCAGVGDFTGTALSHSPLCGSSRCCLQGSWKVNHTVVSGAALTQGEVTPTSFHILHQPTLIMSFKGRRMNRRCGKKATEKRKKSTDWGHFVLQATEDKRKIKTCSTEESFHLWRL